MNDEKDEKTSDVDDDNINSITLDPNNLLIDQPIYRYNLTDDGSCYITIQRLPAALATSSHADFDTMFALHPKARHRVLNGPQKHETLVHRWSQSYLHTPPLDESTATSYMFAGRDPSVDINKPLPDAFVALYNHMRSIDSRFNQVVANWYDHPSDHIAYHSDCDRLMVDDYSIATLTLLSRAHKDDAEGLGFQPFRLKARSRASLQQQGVPQKKYVYRFIDIRMRHGMIVTMHGATQRYFYHGVSPIPEDEHEIIAAFRPNYESRRISLSFRQYPESPHTFLTGFAAECAAMPDASAEDLKLIFKQSDSTSSRDSNNINENGGIAHLSHQPRTMTKHRSTRF